LDPSSKRPTRTRERNKKRETLLIERGPLLNFALSPLWLPHPITDELFCYPGVEWRFQAYKALFIQGQKSPRVIRITHDAIAHARTAREAKNMGRGIQLFNRHKWDIYAYDVMLLANLAKFTQHERSRKALIDTCNAILVEHRRDPIWGDGKDGNGKNWQGNILEKVRAVL
jgi:ribA/ribD-fused uncharacterized protein